MPEAKEKEKEKGGAKAADALSALLSRVAGFFDILDLSFFVSGATSLAALVYMAGREKDAIAWETLSAARVAGIVIASYALGLIVFAFGQCQQNIAAHYQTLHIVQTFPDHRKT